MEPINRVRHCSQRRATGRLSHPSPAILDSQSVKTSERDGARGYDGGKRIKGRKRHMLVAMQGRYAAYLWLAQLPLMLLLRLANIGVGGVMTSCSFIWRLWAPLPHQKGFVVFPKRWIVERTFAWFGHYRA